MPIRHINRKGVAYFLQSRPKRGGGTQLIFSKNEDTSTIEKIPEGHFIHETPDGMVYLRNKADQLVTDQEIELVRLRVPKTVSDHLFTVDFKKDIITIHEAEKHHFDFAVMSFALSKERMDEAAKRNAHFMPVMRFQLYDKKDKSRTFLTERYCFRGTGHWMGLGQPSPLPQLLDTYVKHLGKQSFFELY